MQSLPHVEPPFPSDDICMEQPIPRTKFNISIEKKIERLWQESEKHGWTFTKFITVVLEVLTVLHHRKKLNHINRVPRRASSRRRTLS
jgi:hypothetical protein